MCLRIFIVMMFLIGKKNIRLEIVLIFINMELIKYIIVCILFSWGCLFFKVNFIFIIWGKWNIYIWF